MFKHLPVIEEVVGSIRSRFFFFVILDDFFFLFGIHTKPGSPSDKNNMTLGKILPVSLNVLNRRIIIIKKDISRKCIIIINGAYNSLNISKL